MARVPEIPGDQSAASTDVDETDHFCPGCGVRRKLFARYPWYFCTDCLALAEDGEGRRLSFSNAEIFGGFVWRYADDPQLMDDGSTAVICLIRNREAIVHEARFGGIVAEPLNSFSVHLLREEKILRLLRGEVLAGARKRLKPCAPKL
ncbi:MAG: hypothetical protein KDK08_24000 [Rhizobiaceae bacterium]|nr:hypothetical protein [Rhizobiaceae bacterium]